MDDRTTSHDRLPAQRHAEGRVLFLCEAARGLRAVCALMPGRKALARTLTEPVRAYAGRPLNILEVGAGTGTVTQALIAELSPGSRLDIVEADPRFAKRLNVLVDTHPLLAGQAQRIRVHNTIVEHLDTGRRYDVIVSRLPLTNFTPHQVGVIIDRYLRLLHLGGTLTYPTSMGTRRVHALLASRTHARRHRAVHEVLAAYQRRHATGCWTVWGNLPPSKVWHLQNPTRRAPDPRSQGSTGVGR